MFTTLICVVDKQLFAIYKSITKLTVQFNLYPFFVSAWQCTK